jgi:hypothetical protein
MSEKKSCNNCGNRCMEPSDMNPYCSAVNKPWGQALYRGHPTECGPDFRLWTRDTRHDQTFCKLCKRPKQSFQMFCGAGCSARWEAGERP